MAGLRRAMQEGMEEEPQVAWGALLRAALPRVVFNAAFMVCVWFGVRWLKHWLMSRARREDIDVQAMELEFD
jgi:hypothetical protein